MLPEGRGERQQQVYKMFLDGLFGDPLSPDARRKFWEMARFPHLGRAAKPGGIHTTTAEQENGKLLLGMPAVQVPVFEWYDDEAHLATHEFYMASPEFLKADPAVQDQFVLHRRRTCSTCRRRWPRWSSSRPRPTPRSRRPARVPVAPAAGRVDPAAGRSTARRSPRTRPMSARPSRTFPRGSSRCSRRPLPPFPARTLPHG
jgi:hypothetical protein